MSDQINVIDAAVAVGVRRFIPSEFGNHPESEHKRLPEMRMTQPAKIAVMKHLAEKVVETAGRFSWTAIAVGNFFDWVRIWLNFVHFRFSFFSGILTIYMPTFLALFLRGECLLNIKIDDPSINPPSIVY